MLGSLSEILRRGMLIELLVYVGEEVFDFREPSLGVRLLLLRLSRQLLDLPSLALC